MSCSPDIADIIAGVINILDDDELNDADFNALSVGDILSTGFL